MFGPNINLRFLKKLVNDLQVLNPEEKSLQDIGIRSLHKVDRALIILKSEWDIFIFFDLCILPGQVFRKDIQYLTLS